MSDSTAPWTVAHQAPLYMEFSRQAYWSRLPFLSRLRDQNQVSCTADRFFKQRQRNTQKIRQGGIFPYKVKSPAQNVRPLFFFLITYLTALGLSCGLRALVPSAGIRLGPPALGARTFRHWTTREVPVWALYLLVKKCSRPKAHSHAAE